MELLPNLTSASERFISTDHVPKVLLREAHSNKATSWRFDRALNRSKGSAYCTLTQNTTNAFAPTYNGILGRLLVKNEI